MYKFCIKTSKTAEKANKWIPNVGNKLYEVFCANYTLGDRFDTRHWKRALYLVYIYCSTENKQTVAVRCPTDNLFVCFVTIFQFSAEKHCHLRLLLLVNWIAGVLNFNVNIIYTHVQYRHDWCVPVKYVCIDFEL